MGALGSVMGIVGTVGRAQGLVASGFKGLFRGLGVQWGSGLKGLRLRGTSPCFRIFKFRFRVSGSVSGFGFKA